MPSEAPTLSWPLPRDTLSPSSIATFVRCAEQFRRKYLLGERDPTGVSGLLGTSVHGAQEVNLRQKVITGKDMPLHEVEDAFVDAYNNEIDKSGGVSEIDWKMGDTKLSPSKAKDIARPVNRMYHQKVAPTIQPIATEQWIDFRISGVPPRIVGKIDIMKMRGKVDMKFGKSAARIPKNDWLLQAAIYNLFDDTPFEWHTGSWGSDRNGPAVHTPSSAPALLMASSPQDKAITEALVRSYAAAMVAYYRMFGADEPWPGTGKQHQWACGYCVPLDTQILTQRGWLNHDEVAIGDLTPGLRDDGYLTWTRIENVHHVGEQEIFRLSNGNWSARSTADHRWPTTAGFVKTSDFPFTDSTREESLILSAPIASAWNPRNRERDVALVTWLICDGTFKKTSDRGIIARIYQKKVDCCAEIDLLLSDVPHSKKEYKPGFFTYHIQARYAWYLWGLLTTPGSPTDFVLSLDRDELVAFVDTCRRAEGSDGHPIISQNTGPVADAIALAVYLTGHRPIVRENHGSPNNRKIRIGRDRIGLRRITVESDGREEAWCVTTGLGTWTMRQGEQISLTGNCIFHPDQGGSCAWWPHKIQPAASLPPLVQPVVVQPVTAVAVRAGNLL